MNKEMKVSGNEQQTISELAESGSADSDTAKITWHSPKLRVLQISQETSRPASSGDPA